MTEVAIVRIGRKSSIESEPRTLNFRQIQSARDAALYVVNSRSLEEASQIFTEGMAPIATGGSRNTSANEAGGCIHEEEEEEEYAYPSYSNQHITLDALREVLTAPF